jgi:hypothetical protein
MTTEARVSEVGAELVACLKGARRGFRSDVGRLIQALSAGRLVIPLARDIEGVPEGEPFELTEETPICPFLLSDPEDDGLLFVLFSSPELFTEQAEAEDQKELRYGVVPGVQALEMALEVLDAGHVKGLVIDPGQPSELFLTRSEVGNLVNKNPIPLLGYVAELAQGQEALTVVADAAAPPPPLFQAKVGQCLAELGGVAGHELLFCFNRERDLEPHWAVRVKLEDVDADPQLISTALFRAVEGVVPEPGYLDVVFELPNAADPGAVGAAES